MKIHIRQIKSEGIEKEEMFSPEWVGLTRKDNIRFVEPVDLKAKISRIDEEVFAHIKANSCYESICYRCVSDVKSDWNSDFTLTFDIDKQTEFIEIGEDIRQEIILNLPTRVLCRDNCKGICIDCGVDLNFEQCVCANKSTKIQKMKASS